jgi:hypothetical protein
MKFSCRSGVGWVTRAVTCGLLAGVVIPAAASADPSVPAVSVPIASTSTLSAASTRVQIHQRRTRKSKSAKTQHSSSTRSFMTADSFTGPFFWSGQNPCLPADVVTITGSVTTTVKLQPDGSFWLYQSVNGTGTAVPSGAKYAFSDEIHGAFTFPVGDPIRFYDYYKLYRQADIFSPLGGDDFFLRIYTEIPGSTGGGPSMDSLMTAPVGGECR